MILQVTFAVMGVFGDASQVENLCVLTARPTSALNVNDLYSLTVRRSICNSRSG